MVKSISETAKTIRVFPLGLVTHTPAKILEYAKSHYFHFLHETMRFKYTPAQIFDLEIPFGVIFELFCEIGWDLCEPTIWAIWCNTVQYSIPIALKPLMTYCSLHRQVYRFVQVVYKVVRPSIISTENLFRLDYVYSVCEHFFNFEIK